jgi:hypothetical protein
MSGIEPETYALRKRFGDSSIQSGSFGLDSESLQKAIENAGILEDYLGQVFQNLFDTFQRQLDLSFHFCCRSLANRIQAGENK